MGRTEIIMLTVKRPRPYNVETVFQKESFVSNGYTMPYRLYIPKNYDCGVMYPVLLFLHGAGERGTDNESQLRLCLQEAFNDTESPVYDSIVIAPQCPPERQWVYAPWANGNYSAEKVGESREIEIVLEILDHIAASYNVDADRVYVAGISMGGFGTWDLLMRHGARFAAGIPVCGGGDPAYARKLTRIPIMTFHGSEDAAVPVTATRIMYASIVREGGENISYTEFDGCGHNVWDRVFSDPETIRWLFAQSREERRKAAEKRAKLKKTVAAAGGGAGVLLSMILLAAGKRKKSQNKKGR